jgi:CRP/FNR family transcriptional regulator, cyclic AMP receptor protein
VTVKGVFVRANEVRTYAPGEAIFEQGDESAQMFGVVSGAVELRKDGEPVVVVGPETTFGEMGIISRAPRSLSAVATEQSEIAVIDERTFLFLVQETPMFALQVMQSLAERIRQLDEAG